MRHGRFEMRCPVFRCQTRIHSKRVLCMKHWRMLDKETQLAVFDRWTKADHATEENIEQLERVVSRAQSMVEALEG